MIELPTKETLLSTILSPIDPKPLNLNPTPQAPT